MALAAVGMILSPAAIAQNLNGDTNVQNPGVVEQTKTFSKTTQSTTTSGVAAKASCPMKKKKRKLSFRPILHRKLAAKTVSKPVLIKKTRTFTKTTSSTKTINSPAVVQQAPPPAPAPIAEPACQPICSPVTVERVIQQPTLVQQCQELPVVMVRREITSPVVIEDKYRRASCAQAPVMVEQAAPAMVAAPTCAQPITQCAPVCVARRHHGLLHFLTLGLL